MRGLVLAIAGLCAAAAVALPLVNRPDVETPASLPEAPAMPQTEFVIARPQPVRPELGRPPVLGASRPLDRRGLEPPPAPPEADVVRMPEPEPATVVVASPVRPADQRGRLLAAEQRRPSTPNPKVRLAPDLPGDAPSERSAPAPVDSSGRDRHAQD